MSKQPKDGGPAFPVFPETSAGCRDAFRGMSLRDAAALQVLGSITDDEYQDHDHKDLANYKDLAKYCWRMADAWLAERDGD